jgi:Na+-transporting methylmalonyl-CoA/oxaloacetate decarboxylase gamma subunit
MNWLISDITFDFSAIYGQGITVAIIGYVIVFFALLLSFFLFSNLPKLVYFKTRREHRKKRMQEKRAKTEDDDIHLSADVTAAIAAALYLHYNEIHDPESNVITIQRVRKRYSPWSSKIYGLRKWPHKTF